MNEYSQGICEDGAAILKDGQLMTVEEILTDLRRAGDSIPRPPEGFTPLAHDRQSGEWLYVNHANTWQGCPAPFKAENGGGEPMRTPLFIEREYCLELVRLLEAGCLLDSKDNDGDYYASQWLDEAINRINEYIGRRFDELPAPSAPDGCFELMGSLAGALYAAVHAGKVNEADRIKSDDGTVEIAELLDRANAMLATPQPSLSVPDAWRNSLKELVDAMVDYEMEAECEPPHKHRDMMDRARALLYSQQPLARFQSQVDPIYIDIAEERARQDVKWGGSEHDDQHSPDDWAIFIRRHLSQAVPPIWRRDRYRKKMVQVAALAVAALESHDRLTGKACQKEEFRPDIPVNEESPVRDTKPGCHAGRDGECIWEGCPQIRDNEPESNGRHCPLDQGDTYQ